MGCIATFCGSCCGSCVAGSACACCSKAFACKTGTKTRAPYLIIMFLGVILALVMRYWGKAWVVHLFWFSLELCTSSKCVGYGAAYRISFTLFIFFAVHALAMLSKSGLSFHAGMWFLKVLSLCILLVIAFVIPNPLFDIYSIVCRFVGGFFLLLQIIILIEFAYSWNSDWVADGKEYYKSIIASAIILFGGAITLWVFMFDWFDQGGSCHRNKFFIAWTIISCVLLTLISISKWCKHGAILPSAVVSLYCTYICYSALRSDPSSCNNFVSDDAAQVAISIVIAGATIVYAGWNLSNSSTIFGVDDEDMVEDEEKGNASPSSGAAAEDKDHSPDDDPKAEWKRKRNLKFHVVMAAASMYVAMLITNWGSQTESSAQAYDLGEVSMWIKIVSQWITFLLYAWTLCAPYLFPNRDFGVDIS